MRFLCKMRKDRNKTLTPNDFKGLEIKSKKVFFSNICTNCNSEFVQMSNIRYAKCINQWYFFCDDYCWSKWCQSFNK